MTLRRLGFFTAIIAVGFLSSKLLGLARELIIAHQFGTSGNLDAYYAAFNFPDLLFALIPGGALASVLIPVLSTYLVDESRRDEGWKLISGVVNLVLIVVALLAFLGALGAPILVSNVLAPGFDAARQALTIDLMRIVLISTILFSVSGVITAALHAHNSFILPALAPSLYNLGIIGGALFLAPRLGVYGLAYGVLSGSALHLFIQLPALVRQRARYFFTLGFASSGFAELVRLFAPRLVTLGVVRVNNILMTNLASGLAAGSIAGLNYAYQIWQFPESMIGTAIALAVFPTLSGYAARGTVDQLRRTFDIAMGVILALAIPSSLALIFLARPAVAIVFQRGAFQAASTEVVASILQLYAIAVIGESALELAARLFYAQHDARTPMFVALVAMLLRAGLMLAWSSLLGAPGLALAYAIGVTAEAFVLYVIARRRLGHASAEAAVASAP